MKTFSKEKTIKFGLSAVNAGQRNVVCEPQLIATSTDGGFRVTAPVTKALGLQHGENIMFVSNIDAIDMAIAQKDENLVNFCEEQGLDFGSVEATNAIHKEFDVWAIAKGIVERDTKGNVKKTSMRLTKEDRLRFVEQRYEEMLASAKESNDESLVDAITREGITEEEVKDILCDYVVADEVDKVKGSKLASTSGVTGVGVNLTFTDTNVWKQLKYDLGENSGKINRVFSIDMESMTDVEIYDGYENILVKALVLGDFVDKEPSRIQKDK